MSNRGRVASVYFGETFFVLSRLVFPSNFYSGLWSGHRSGLVMAGASGGGISVLTLFSEISQTEIVDKQLDLMGSPNVLMSPLQTLWSS